MLRTMNPSATAATARRRIDPAVWARRVRRGTLVVAVVLLVAAFALFGTQWVPAGMDTVPDVPAGSYCILDKRLGAAQVGRDVFVTTPAGNLVLSRVVARDAETITVNHPNAGAAAPDSRSFGALPLRAVRGTVICVFPPDTASPARGR